MVLKSHSTLAPGVSHPGCDICSKIPAVGQLQVLRGPKNKTATDDLMSPAIWFLLLGVFTYITPSDSSSEYSLVTDPYRAHG